MISGAVRIQGETYAETITRLGPMGLRMKRKELQDSAEKELKKIAPKSYHEIKEEVLQEAMREADHFRFRAERISTRVRERFQPAEWWYAPSYGEFEEEEAEIAMRISSARTGSFQPGVSSFETKMG